MPELSKPLIAVIGVLVSIAILFIAVLGILPFLQGTVGSVSQSAQFSAVASAATTESGGTINKVIFTVTVQKLAGTGTFSVKDTGITIFDPSGTSHTIDGTNIKMGPSTTLTFTQATTFTIEVDISGAGITTTTGDWALAITVYDSSNTAVQSLSVTVPVT